MSDLEGVDYDPYEYAEQLGYTDELTKDDFTDPSAVRATTKSGISRRELLKRGGVGAAAVAGLGAFAGPAAARPAASGAFTGTLSVISLGVEWATPRIQAQAEKDLGYKFNIQLMGTNALVQKSITDADSFDVGGLYNYQYFQIWPTGNYVPVDTRKLTAWSQLYPLFTKGRIRPGNKAATLGQGNAPYRVTFVDPGRKGKWPLTTEGPKTNKEIVVWWDAANNKAINGLPQPRFIVGPPAHFNMDSMGYNADVIQKAADQVSWAELLNNKWKGRVALLNDPGIMTQDAGNAVQAMGLMKFKDLGNMTKPEMDRLFKILTTYKKNGHFRSFWATFNDSVNLFSSKEVVIESMWSPAVALLVAQGLNCRYANPKEGMRGWCSAQGITASAAQDPAKLQAAYDYFNWMHAGFMGAEIMRQGYYVANGARLRNWIATQGAPYGFTTDEFDFWYLGKPAAKNLPGITGQPTDIKQGQVRDGGSFQQRSSKYSSWNSFFTQNVYQIKKANEFLSS